MLSQWDCQHAIAAAMLNRYCNLTKRFILPTSLIIVMSNMLSTVVHVYFQLVPICIGKVNVSIALKSIIYLYSIDFYYFISNFYSRQ